MASGTPGDRPPAAGAVRRAGIRLRLVLTVPFLALLILATGLIGWISFRNGQRAVGDISRQLLAEVNARILGHLDAFLDPPRRINGLNADAIGRGAVDPRDQEALQRQFLRQVRVYESVSSAYFGNAAGGLANAGREGGAGPLYVIGTEGFAAGRLVKRTVDAEDRPATVVAAVASFDARTRPWYEVALRRDGPSWTDPYVLSTGQDMAISASLPVRDASGSLLGVASVDIFLSQLGAFMVSLPVGRTGHSFIMDPSGLLIASSQGESPFAAEGGGAALRRLEARRSGSPAIRAGADALARRPAGIRAPQEGLALETAIGGARYFVQASPYRCVDGLDWLVVSVVPESDFMERIEANNRAALLTIAAALGAALAIGIATARLISRPIVRLNESTKSIVRGDWGREVGDGVPVVEIRELTSSFNAMVARLRQAMERLTAEIEERKQAEAAVRVTMEKYRVLFDSFPLGVSVSDKAGRIVETNREAERILGIGDEEHRKRTLDDAAWRLIRPDGTPMPPAEFPAVRALREGRLVEGAELGVVGGEDRVIWLHVTAAPMPLSGYGVAVAFGDITERKRIEAELRRSERKLRYVVEQSVDGIVLTDEEGRIIEWNPAMEAMTGIGSREILGRVIWDAHGIFLSPERRTPETVGRILEALQGFFRTGALPGVLKANTQMRILKADGEPISVESSIFPIRTEEGFMLGNLVRDVTERRRAERERERLIEELQTALREVKQLSGLLPICAHCKKIRDDQGYWHQVEAYIGDHAGVEFSHGLCPDCLAKFYPEYHDPTAR